MGTIVTIHVAPPDSEEAIDTAFGWFREVEACCSRFLPDSELTKLTAQVGVPVPVSPILFETLQFALLVAEETKGAFDPTAGGTGGSYRDVLLDPKRQTVKLRQPVTLDLGAVAKGMAIDAAARELEEFRDFAIDAGGDLYLGGLNPEKKPWSVGIRNPRHEDAMIQHVRVSGKAVCTSGDYERGHHIIDPRTGQPCTGVAGATVIAPSAMLADSLATAAFVLGPKEGIAFLDSMEVEGLILTPELERYATRGFPRVA